MSMFFLYLVVELLIELSSISTMSSSISSMVPSRTSRRNLDNNNVYTRRNFALCGWVSRNIASIKEFRKIAQIIWRAKYFYENLIRKFQIKSKKNTDFVPIGYMLVRRIAVYTCNMFIDSKILINYQLMQSY